MLSLETGPSVFSCPWFIWRFPLLSHFHLFLLHHNFPSGSNFTYLLWQSANAPGVNSIDMLYATFSHQSALYRFSRVTFWHCNFLAQKASVKCWWNWPQFYCQTCSKPHASADLFNLPTKCWWNQPTTTHSKKRQRKYIKFENDLETKRNETKRNETIFSEFSCIPFYIHFILILDRFFKNWLRSHLNRNAFMYYTALRVIQLKLRWFLKLGK